MINTPISSTALLKLLVAILLSLSPSIAFTQPEEATFQGIEFVKVTPGTFTLGSITSQEGRIANETERRVLIDHSFWIGKYEVTQGQWQAVMGSNPSTFRALGPDLSYPVETVSWYDAQQFIEALNANAGGVYFRLPTEAEWEYVAKANTHGRWSFGEIEAALSDHAYRDGVHKPRMRGGKLANAWGVYDLYGNVYEWCEDWYQMSARPERGACPPEMGTYKVIRGGSNTAHHRYLRSSSRNFAHPDRLGYYIGLRLVRVMDPLADQYRSDAQCATPPFCGDGVLNGVEECDDGNLIEDDDCDSSCLVLNANGGGGAPCAEGEHVVAHQCHPCPQGTTRPAGDPTSGADTSCLQIGCGEGVVNGLEACDSGLLNSDFISDACRLDCTLPRCGDGVLDAGEECDDGAFSGADFCDDQCLVTSMSVPLLVLMIDFNDSDMDGQLPNSEQEWSTLMFGNAQGQGNHYWSEVFPQGFSLIPVNESAGTPQDGVVRVHVSAPRPSGGDQFKIEDQPWIPEALDAAANDINFAAYDLNGNGLLENQELSVFVVLNMNYSNISGAGAQANINLNHSIAGTGITLPKFARTLFSYSSIGVNLHELGHHIFSLKHFAPPGDHGLMSTGAYAQDPTIGLLTNSSDHWGTRPTHLTGFSRLKVRSVTPQIPYLDEVGSTQVTLNSIHTGSYNMTILPTADGYLILENRERIGYDQSVPFCDTDQGGLFIMDIAQYISPLDVANIRSNNESLSYIETFDFCDHYALQGHHDDFTFGGYHFSNISTAGPSMTLQIAKDHTPREIEALKWRWFKIDPDRVGYRLWWYEEVTELAPTVIDFSEIPDGDNPDGYFTFTLQGYYTTGEIRSLNAQATWHSSSDYVSVQTYPVSGGEGTTLGDAIVRVEFISAEACPVDRRAVITAQLDGVDYQAELTELPCP